MRLLLPVLLLLEGCATPLGTAGGPSIDGREASYWIWSDDGVWHLRVTGGSHAHRFQGTVASLSGGVTSLAVTHGALQDRAALLGHTAQFDLEPTHEL